MTTEKPKKSRRWIKILAGAVILTGLMAVFTWQVLVFAHSETLPVFCDGVSVDDLDVGGKTWDQALELLEKKQRLKGKTLLFALEREGDQWFIDGGEVGYYNTEEVLLQAWSVGRGELAWLRYLERLEARLLGWRFQSAYTMDRSMLETRLKTISREMYTAPVNARLMAFDASAPAGERIRVRDDVPGYGLDIESMTDACVEAYDQKGWGTIVPLALGTVEADITSADLLAMDPPIVSYSYRPDDYHELREILEESCGAVGAVVLDPGEVFSLRERLAAAGLSALDRRIHLPTVLYGAAVYAELTVLEHHREEGMGLPVVPGLEAVTGEGMDLVFRNETGHAVVVWPRADSNQLIAEVYRLPYENCAYIRVVGIAEGQQTPRVYRVYCDERGVELGREPVESGS